MKEEFEKLKAKNYSDEKFERYVNNKNVHMRLGMKNITELKALWYGEKVMEEEKEVLDALFTLSEEKPYDSMNKDELDEYANSVHGIDLDKRFKKETMIEELEEELKKQNEE